MTNKPTVREAAEALLEHPAHIGKQADLRQALQAEQGDDMKLIEYTGDNFDEVVAMFKYKGSSPEGKSHCKVTELGTLVIGMNVRGINYVSNIYVDLGNIIRMNNDIALVYEVRSDEGQPYKSFEQIEERTNRLDGSEQ